MRIADILSLEHIHPKLHASSKKDALEQISSFIANHEPNLCANEIFDGLISRERLGSTALGHGIAIPHARLKTIKKTLAAFIKLEKPIDFDAIDQQPIDLIFTLLVPEESTQEHLEILAKLAEAFSQENFLQALRTCSSKEELFESLLFD